MADSMWTAVVQLTSRDDVGENLARAGALVREAAERGASLVALPENFAFMGDEVDKRAHAEDLSDEASGPILDQLRRWATDHALTLVAGGMPERSEDPTRPFNSSVLVAPDGRVAAVYRKIHLFDVKLPDGTELTESRGSSAGDAIVVAEAGGVGLGMSVCYDVRFPELYRAMVDRGARLVTVPAAFTVTTGRDHWHTLLRARAIENQVFVVAPAQHGSHGRGRTTYGKSLIVDPWGDVLAQCGEGPGLALAKLDFAAQDRVRASLPCLDHRRLR